MKYESNRNVVWSCHYHVVWCPKYRRRVLEGEVATRLEEIVREVCAGPEVSVEAMEVMPDHVHLLITVDPRLGVHRAVKRVKGASSRILREEFPGLRSRLPTLWTNWYFVSTTGGAPLDAIMKYVENQKNV